MEEKTTTSAAEKPAESGCFFCATAMPLLRQVVSETTHEHFRTSRIEFLKGVRSLIDDRINRLSKTEAKGTTVVVE